MLKQAAPINDAYLVDSHTVLDGIGYLTIINPTNDYDGFRAAPGAMQYEGREYGKSSFNSDLGTITYRTDKKFARSRGRE